MNFALAIDHKYRLANGKVALITGIQEGIAGVRNAQLLGVIVGESAVLRWRVEDGHALTGGSQFDLVELVSGPTRVQRVGTAV
jgi:hypothetical protein